MTTPTLSEAAKRWRPWVSARARQLDKANGGRGLANWLRLRQDRKAGALILASEWDCPEVEALAVELQDCIAADGPAIPVRVEVEGLGTVVAGGSFSIYRGQEVG
jgi:hypothetical protein